MAISMLNVADHEVVGAGLKNFLHGSDIRTVAEADSATTWMKLTVKHKPDVVAL